METPPAETFSPRRSQRTVFGEIPTRMGALTMNETPTGTRNNNNNTVLPLLQRSEDNISRMLLTPSPSPDELVIQQRSRRRAPVVWSPDIDHLKREGQLPPKDRTPVKHNGMSPNSKSSIVLRSTPRKRLLLNDPMEMSPDKRKASSPKKSRLERPQLSEGPVNCPVNVLLKGLTSEQLIGVLNNLMGKHPGLEEEVKQCLPPPDIRPLEDQLNYLKRNIFKSLPNSRLTSRTDSPAYSRAATHLNAFKKCVTEQARTLVESQQWGAVLEYVLMAWSYVRATPLWDNPPHNAARRSCFKTLAAHCMFALKRCQFPIEYLKEYYNKIQGFTNDSEDFHSCLKYLEMLKDG